jgi:hypothetical protein
LAKEIGQALCDNLFCNINYVKAVFNRGAVKRTKEVLKKRLDFLL